MSQEILNGKELRQALGISTTTFYKFKKAGMPYHQLPASRAYFILDEVENWLGKAGYHIATIIALNAKYW
ncbi:MULTISPECIES: AlpA family transcriptional regulator [Lactobacillus]|uniref:Helix-turn-helix domain-containing protein n=1 Tax=Lactobacillus xujianguonis TaxID=2495899 RepID=A0A437SWX9_9LACO|nr:MULTISPECIES: hypothetical protein [Lactobacillus]RVU71419.1 hypothetical protein EJK17_02970 [Lactobacillus xujianguonis]